MTVEIDDETSGKCIYKAGKHMLYVTKTLDGQVVKVYNFGEVKFRYGGKATKRPCQLVSKRSVF